MNFHPDILKLETVEIDVTYSKEDKIGYVGFDNKFFVVPTEMVISGDKDLWKGCPSLVNWDILDCIKEIKAEGKYPYNDEVGIRFIEKHNLPLKYSDGTFLSAMVYCTQSYLHSLDDEETAKLFHEAMTQQGFIKATPDILNEVADSKRKFTVYAAPIKSTKLILKTWQDRGLYWMNPRATRSGYKAKIGQYIKEAI